MSDYKEIWESEYIQTKIKEVWNAAIEEAAKHCDDMGEEARISLNIRELKK